MTISINPIEEELPLLVEKKEESKTPLFEKKITLNIKPKVDTVEAPSEQIEQKEGNQEVVKRKITRKEKPVQTEKQEDISISNDLSRIEFNVNTEESADKQDKVMDKFDSISKQDEEFKVRHERRMQFDESTMEFDYPPNPEKTIIVSELRKNSVGNLIEIAEGYGVTNCHRMLKQELISQILKQTINNEKLIYSDGVIEVVHDGHGFIRSHQNNYTHSGEDVFISNNQMRKFGLRFGDHVAGYTRVPKKGEKYFSLMRLMELNGRPSDEIIKKISFENLTPLYPNQKLNFESPDPTKSISTRVIDLISPIGKGQRALIVSPPKSGKTMLLQNIAHAINHNHPEIELIYLGIDERPEEFTEMQRTIKGEVVSSTFDEPAQRHVALAEIIIEKAKRMVEHGKDVVILLDSITRLARAYNNAMPSSGKILSGGVDSNALHRPKRFFGAARNIEHGGSLTIIATALIDTGSKMDEVIFEEFKGTGNAEIVLDRKFADKRIFPAIDVLKSGTRKEEEMVSSETLTKMWMLRRVVSGMGSGGEALEFLIKKIKDSKNNEDFFKKMNSPIGFGD